jgi:hypothetical protein
MPRKFMLAVAAAAAVLSSAVATAQSTLQLLDAGAAPRETVRYRFETGRSETGVLDTRMQMAMSLGGQQMPAEVAPPLRMTTQMRVVEVTAEGKARVEYKLLSAEAAGSDAQAADLNRSLAQVKGFSGFYHMDTLGQITPGTPRLPEGAAAPGSKEVLGELEQSTSQLTVPFPAEAIGAGARWQVTQKVDSSGIQLSQVVEYVLRARTADRVELDVKMVSASLEASAALPPGAKVDSIQLGGTGTSIIQLDRLVPTAAVDSSIALAVSMVAQGQTQNLGLNLKMHQAIAPLKP